VRACVGAFLCIGYRQGSVSQRSVNQSNQSINQVASPVPADRRPWRRSVLQTRLGGPRKPQSKGPPVVRRLRAHRSPIAANRTPLELSSVSVTANHHGPPLQHLDSRSM
jgi:hypothetical protein